MRQYFWLNREILPSKYFQYFDRSKKRHDRAKIGLAGQHDRPPVKIVLRPVMTCHTKLFPDLFGSFKLNIEKVINSKNQERHFSPPYHPSSPLPVPTD